MGNRTLVVGQSGGATAVTNATLAGITSAAQRAGFTRILGMRHGMVGLLQNEFHDLTALSASTLEQLVQNVSKIVAVKFASVFVYEPEAQLIRIRATSLPSARDIPTISSLKAFAPESMAWPVGLPAAMRTRPSASAGPSPSSNCSA